MAHAINRQVLKNFYFQCTFVSVLTGKGQLEAKQQPRAKVLKLLRFFPRRGTLSFSRYLLDTGCSPPAAKPIGKLTFSTSSPSAVHDQVRYEASHLLDIDCLPSVATPTVLPLPRQLFITSCDIEIPYFLPIGCLARGSIPRVN